MSKAETSVARLKAVLAAGLPDADVKRADGWPDTIDGGRLVVIFENRDADPEDQLGTEGPWYIAHPLQIGIAARAGTADARHAAFDLLLTEFNAVLQADLTLGGEIFGMTWSRPAIDAEAFPGNAGIKAGLVELTLEYQSDTRV
ncbi:MAG: hypothetical protein ACRC67_18275 [Inquilinus sp.]|uniref:hypothetical protein n=1 Tax=Inquilinus sp. TaxID=1932117 RepID=UPI003F3728D3